MRNNHYLYLTLFWSDRTKILPELYSTILFVCHSLYGLSVIAAIAFQYLIGAERRQDSSSTIFLHHLNQFLHPCRISTQILNVVRLALLVTLKVSCRVDTREQLGGILNHFSVGGWYVTRRMYMFSAQGVDDKLYAAKVRPIAQQVICCLHRATHR